LLSKLLFRQGIDLFDAILNNLPGNVTLIFKRHRDFLFAPSSSSDKQ